MLRHVIAFFGASLVAIACASGESLDSGSQGGTGGSLSTGGGPGLDAGNFDGAGNAAGVDGGGGTGGGMAGTGGLGVGGMSGMGGKPPSDAGTDVIISLDSGSDAPEGGPTVCPPNTGDCDGDPSNGCERGLTTLTDCGGCDTPCDLANANESCTGGACTLDTCVTGFDNCNGETQDGCEVQLDNDTNNCGACGVQCMNDNGTVSCSGGNCVPICDPGFDDCDGDPLNGCETPLNTLTNCGSCGTPCDIPGSGETCASGSCMTTGCMENLADCDGMPGCEADLRSDVNNCGGCGIQCTNDNGTTSCVAGACVPVCAANFDSCDGDANNGCETSLRTATDCGSCNNPCTFPTATGDCSTGTCELGSCNPGRSNCDVSEANGCELDHTFNTNLCSNAEDLGSQAGDVACGFVCGGTPTVNFAMGDDRQNRWFRAFAEEVSSCPADVQHVVRLTSPPGIDYDLFVYSSCGNLIGSSENGMGQTDSLTIVKGEDLGSDDSFIYFIEVRYFSGSSCSEFTLSLIGRSC